ncbi:MAG: RIP metalloprotease RseP [Pseudomonadota bacterium]|nr:MAG: RIP metalloprotease RseP [Pseudomonadota bacterium]
MSQIPLYVAAFIVALGILITVHEFGHFWVARRLGVKVLRFSIGFGKPIWMRRIGPDQMELVVAALPLGGYVKMLDEHEGDVETRDLPRAFNRQPLWKRMAIVVAGPLFNFLFAILAYWAIFVGGIDGLRPVVGHVVPNSLAAQAGFRTDDTILRIDGKAVQTWDHRRLYWFERALDRVPVYVEVRDGEGRLQSRTVDLSGLPASEIGASLVERNIGLLPRLPLPLPVIGALEPGPAERAGMRVGDRIVEIDGQRVSSWETLSNLVRENPGRELNVKVERAGSLLGLVVTPDAVEQAGRKIGRIQIRPQLAEMPADMRVRLQFGPLEAVGEALDNTWAMSWLTLRMLYKMLLLEVSTQNISGPITIAQYAGQSARVGIDQFVAFLAVISISLAVLNLLPIPVLDGGHLLYYLAEAVIRRPLPDRVLIWGQQVGIALLALLMLLAFYNDLTRLFS